MNATAVPTEISAFAAAVRTALADLSADEVEELTDGLEADLTEAFSEDLARELPDPKAYAEELRSAAGLPTRATKQHRLGEIRESLSGWAGDVNRRLRRNAIVAAAMDYLVTLRPAWWIVRGWAAYQFTGAVLGYRLEMLPQEFKQWFVLIIMVVGSVVVGLRAWPKWSRALIIIGNVVAAICLLVSLSDLPTHAEINDAWNELGQDSSSSSGDDAGVYAGGNEVTNIFAYDSAGQPLKGVQLFDQDGKPIRTSTPGGNGCLVWASATDVDENGNSLDGSCKTPGAWLSVTLETGTQAWNVYPMQMAESTEDDPSTPIPGAVAQDRVAPFIKVPGLQQSSATASPIPAPTPTAKASTAP